MEATTEKIAAIERAIADLQSGKRVTSVQYGETRIQYAEVDLNTLLQERARLKSHSKSSPRHVIFSTSKGV